MANWQGKIDAAEAEIVDLELRKISVASCIQLAIEEQNWTMRRQYNRRLVAISVEIDRLKLKIQAYKRELNPSRVYTKKKPVEIEEVEDGVK